MDSDDSLISIEVQELDCDKLLWTKTSVIHLAELYKKEKCLYDPQHPGYNNKDLRLKAMNRITKELSYYFPNVDLRSVKKKIMKLRSQYSHEYEKSCGDEDEFDGCDGDFYKSRPFWYRHMEFLTDYINKGSKGEARMNTEKVKEEKITPPDLSYEDTQSNIDFPMPAKRSKIKQILPFTSTNSIYMPINKSLLDDSFLQYIGLEMASITDENIKTQLRKSIILQLFDAKAQQQLEFNDKTK